VVSTQGKGSTSEGGPHARRIPKAYPGQHGYYEPWGQRGIELTLERNMDRLVRSVRAIEFMIGTLESQISAYVVKRMVSGSCLRKDARISRSQIFQLSGYSSAGFGQSAGPQRLSHASVLSKIHSAA